MKTCYQKIVWHEISAASNSETCKSYNMKKAQNKKMQHKRVKYYQRVKKYTLLW